MPRRSPPPEIYITRCVGGGVSGGKQQLAAAILKLIPEHKTYVEPFVVGAAIYFAKEPSKCEVINDTNEKVD